MKRSTGLKDGNSRVIMEGDTVLLPDKKETGVVVYMAGMEMFFILHKGVATGIGEYLPYTLEVKEK